MERNTTRLNYPLLIGSFVFAGLLIIGSALLYVRQRSLTIQDLERQANQLISQKRFRDAYFILETLSQLDLHKPRLNLDFAWCADEIANTSRQMRESVRLNLVALSICQATPGWESEIPTIRKRLIKRDLQLANYEDAISHISRLVGDQVDTDLQRFYTVAKIRLWLQGSKAGNANDTSSNHPGWYTSLIGMHPVDLLVKTHNEIPEDFEIAGILVDLCLGDPSKLSGSYLAGENQDALRLRAKGIVDRLVANRTEDPFSWLLRYEISSRDNSLGRSEDDIEKAIALGPKDPKVLRVAGKLYIERAKRVTGVSNKLVREQYLTRGFEILQRAKESNPTDTSTYVSIGEVLLLQGKTEEAIEFCRDAKRLCSDNISLLDFQIVNSLIALRRFPDAYDALLAMDKSINKDLASLSLAERFAYARQGLECKSRYFLAVGNFQSAIDSLTAVIARGKELDSTNQAMVYSALGDAYRQIGQHDKSAAAYEQAIILAPINATYRRRSAAAWYSASRLSEAFKQYLLVEPKEVKDWIQICNLILEMQRQADQDSNYWFTFDKGIATIKRQLILVPEAIGKSYTLELLELDANVIRSPESARTEAIKSASERLWEMVRRENLDTEVVRAAIMRWKDWNQTEYLTRINQELEETTDEQAKSIDIERAELLITLGNETRAKQLLETKLQANPDNLQIQEAVSRLELAKLPFDQAIESVRKLKQGGWFVARQLAWLTLGRPLIFTEEERRNPALRNRAMEKRVNELKTIEQVLKEFEGSEGTEWRYIKGRRLLAESTDPEQVNSIELQDLVSFLDRKRPQWPETHLLAGMVAQLQGNQQRAIRELNYAIQYGNNDLDTYERLVSILYQQGLLVDARLTLERLGKRAYASQSLTALTLKLSSDSDQEQLRSAELVTEIRPNDPMSWIWNGQILELQSRKYNETLRLQALTKAEKSFEQAAEIAPKNDLRVAMARFNFYSNTRNSQAQQQILEEIKENKDIEPGIQAIAIGQIQESLGEPDLAIQEYLKAIAIGQNDLELRTRIAQLYVREGRLEEAIGSLKETLEKHPKDVATRRRLATLLANRNFDEDWQQVADLLSPRERSNSPEDVRLQVVLLSQKNDLASLQKAQTILERLVELPGVRTDEDQFQLATLYIRTARMLEEIPGRNIDALQTKEAAGRILKLLSYGPSPKPEYVATYADYLIEQKRFFDAMEESQRLDSLAPGSFSAVLLKARLLKIEGDNDTAKNFILAWLADKRSSERASLSNASNRSKIANFLVQAGQALQIIGENQESQQLLQEAYKLDRRAGINYIRSVFTSDDATTRNNAVIYLMERLKSEGTNESAVLLSLLVRRGDTQEQLFEDAHKQLIEYSVSKKDDRVVLQSLADLWIWRGDESQAIETYKRIIQERPNDAVALNNLAVLLADSPNDSAESLQYIDRAIGLIGANPSLMDSKAYVLLRTGRASEAIEILRTLSAKDNSPSVQFHLYQAYVRAELRDQAQELLRSIDINALRNAPMTRADQQELEKISSAQSGQ